MRYTLLALALTLAACQPADEPAEAVPPMETGAAETPAAAPTAKLNLNTTPGDDFRAVPNVGDKMVHEFQEYRPWTSVGQFRREIGKYIDDDQAKLDEYLQYVFVPVDMNEADAETLQQLPGVSSDEAEALIAGRPYASSDEFLTAYESISGEPDAEAARTYLAQ